MGDFKCDIKQMCMQDNYGIQAKQQQVTTIHVQANAIIEQLHKLSMGKICSDHLSWKIIMKI
jgi:hypothetical protein